MQLDIDCLKATIAEQRDADRISRLWSVECLQQVDRRFDFSTADLNENIAELDVAFLIFVGRSNPGRSRSAVLEDISDECPVWNSQPTRDLVIEQTQAQHGVLDPAMLN